MAAEQKFLVLGNFVNQFTRGDVAEASAFAWEGASKKDVEAQTSAMVADKSIREATEWEAQLKSVPPEYVTDKPHAAAPKALVEAQEQAPVAAPSAATSTPPVSTPAASPPASPAPEGNGA